MPISTIYRSEQSWENFRFAVVDSEATGLDAKRDRLITIGGIAVERGDIELSDYFEILMPIAYNTSSVTIHGITKEQSEEGMEEQEAIKQFINWLGDSVIVGHHIEHDIEMFNQAIEPALGYRLENPYLDTMDLALRLVDAGAFGEDFKIKKFSLDALCEVFSVVPHDRHTASGDAFITAQILIRLLRAARKCNFLTLGELCEKYQG